MDKTLLDALIVTDEDRAEFLRVAVEDADYNACCEMVVNAMNIAIEMGATSKTAFLTKLTLIARWAYIYGYGRALNDLQLVQQAEIDKLHHR